MRFYIDTTCPECWIIFRDLVFLFSIDFRTISLTPPAIEGLASRVIGQLLQFIISFHRDLNYLRKVMMTKFTSFFIIIFFYFFKSEKVPSRPSCSIVNRLKSRSNGVYYCKKNLFKPYPIYAMKMGYEFHPVLKIDKLRTSQTRENFPTPKNNTR